MTNKQKNKAAQEMARLHHLKNPNPREQYVEMQRLSTISKKRIKAEKLKASKKRSS